MKTLSNFGYILTLQPSYGNSNAPTINYFTNCSGRKKKEGKVINVLVIQFLAICNAFFSDRSKEAVFWMATFRGFITLCQCS